jgi:hypothetical protein
VVPTIGLKLLYSLVVLGHDRRQLLSFGITAHPTTEWLDRASTYTSLPQEAKMATLTIATEVHLGNVGSYRSSSMLSRGRQA